MNPSLAIWHWMKEIEKNITVAEEKHRTMIRYVSNSTYFVILEKMEIFYLAFLLISKYLLKLALQKNLLLLNTDYIIFHFLKAIECCTLKLLEGIWHLAV